MISKTYDLSSEPSGFAPRKVSLVLSRITRIHASRVAQRGWPAHDSIRGARFRNIRAGGYVTAAVA
jgi:hypothetical protein